MIAYHLQRTLLLCLAVLGDADQQRATASEHALYRSTSPAPVHIHNRTTNRPPSFVRTCPRGPAAAHAHCTLRLFRRLCASFSCIPPEAALDFTLRSCLSPSAAPGRLPPPPCGCHHSRGHGYPQTSATVAAGCRQASKRLRVAAVRHCQPQDRNVCYLLPAVGRLRPNPREQSADAGSIRPEPRR